MREEKVLAYLKANCAGRQRARKGARIGSDLRMSEKDVQKAVARLRRKGIPIASGPEGYFYALTAAEVFSTLQHLQDMEHGLHASIVGLVGCLDNFGERGRA